MIALSDRDLAMLALERTWYRRAGSKEQAVRDLLGLDATRYYMLLGQLIDRREALEHDPVTVGRLRRLRDERARMRSLRRTG